MSDRRVPEGRPPWWRAAEPGRRLLDKRVIVTGAGTRPGGDLLGVGEAIAVLFAAQGARVAVADVSRERAEATMELVAQVGGEAVMAVGDLTVVDENARCVEEAVTAFGGLDTVVNCAALSHGSGSPVDVDLEVWDRVMAVNLRATLLTARHAVPHLRDAGGGAIVNVSTIAAARGLGGGAYAASKAAMGALTRDWAYLHGDDRIRVNALLVGHVVTPMGVEAGPELRRMRHRANLLPEEGTAWDAAWPAVFLASDESRWITGVELPVDAGTISTTAFGIELLGDRGRS